MAGSGRVGCIPMNVCINSHTWDLLVGFVCTILKRGGLKTGDVDRLDQGIVDHALVFECCPPVKRDALLEGKTAAQRRLR